jgi:phospholipid/cholesterol/gamma-HCH transport system substrate-binding protein
MRGQNFKAGIFVMVALVLLVAMVLRVSQGSLFFSSAYTIYMDVPSAVGISKNTPVMVAGVDIGVVDSVTLSSANKARLKLAIKKDFTISQTATGHIKTTGILGDAYIEIQQKSSKPRLEPDGVISDVLSYGDFNSLTASLGLIAADVKVITSQMRKTMEGDDSSFNKIVKNIEKITKSLSNVTTKNEKNLNVLIANLKTVSQNLNYVVAKNMGKVGNSFTNIEDITGTIARGEGTVGKLIKDDVTVEKINDALDGINDFLGGGNRLKVDLGMHSEYLAGTGDFKNYVSLNLSPRPDKYFLFEVVSDPDPSFVTAIEETVVTSGGASTTVTTERRNKTLDGFRFTAQIAKKYHDFTIRGGLIESSGGVGLDFDKGPVGLSFSAFDFKSTAGQRPHLKALGKANLTSSFYLLGGVDDIINQNQDLAWFLGAGLSFTDDDIKSLFGILSAGASASK